MPDSRKDDPRIENVAGALALAMSDDLLWAAQAQAPETGSAAAAIALLGHEPGMPIERLRRALRLSHPGTVRLVDRLERHGLVTRRQSKRDRRAVALVLTSGGKKARRAVLSARQRTMALALASLTPDEKVIFGKLADKMLRAVLRNEDHAYAVCRLCDEAVCVHCPVDAEFRARA